MQSTFFGFVYKSFVGWTTTSGRLLGPNGKLAQSVFPKDTTMHNQRGNRIGNQQFPNHYPDALPTMLLLQPKTLIHFYLRLLHYRMQFNEMII